jgi:phenylalanyl-tRNA synthetase beta chain
MHSEAAYRFSRNVHPALAETGVRLCLRRMAEWSEGTIHDGLVDAYPQPYHDPLVSVSEADVQRLLGIHLDAGEIAVLLERFEFTCRVDGNRVEAKSPPYRTDIGEGLVGMADVIEEIARLKGYDSIPATRLSDELPPQRGNAAEERDRFFQDMLVSMGLQEVVTYRLTSPEAEARLLPDGAHADPPAYVELLNPISEERRVMRRSLLASVLETLERNIRVGERLALFEIGPVFLPVKGQPLPEEQARLAIALSGRRVLPAWDQNGADELDFFDLKGIVEALLEGLHIAGARFEATERPGFHPAKCARLSVNGEEIGWLGELDPRVKARYSPLEPAVLAADLDAGKLYGMAPRGFEAAPVPAYPPVIEDLALIVDEALPNDQVVETIRAAGGFLLKRVELFDIFRGGQIGAGSKSLAYRLTYQAPNRTLTDAEAGKVRERIMQALEKNLGAKVRKAEG